MALSQTTVLRLYNTVMEDVIAGVRENFLDDGVDETVLQELRQLWETKLLASKAVEQNPEPPELQPPPIVANLKANGNKPGNTKKGLSHPVDHHPSPGPGPGVGTNQLPNTNSNATLPTQGGSHNQTIGSNLIGLDPNNKVPVQLTLPAQAGVPGSQPRVFTLQIPTSALQNNQLHQVLTGPIITATMNMPQPLAATLLQQHINASLSGQPSAFNNITANSVAKSQTDGPCDSSDDEISDGIGSDEDGEAEGDGDGDGEGDGAGSDGAGSEGAGDDGDEDGEQDGVAEEEPLNSGDDVSEEDPSDMFDSDNVVVCQYDKITRSRNKWRFYLKDGIMNLSGRDYVFQKANGDAEW